MACFLTKLKNSTIKRKNDILNMFDNKTIKEPIKPFAFIRAFNEIKTIKASLDSIVGVIDKGVIVYHMDDDGADDGTENVILSFCKQNQGFKAIKYPHKIAPPGADWGGGFKQKVRYLL